MGSAVLPEDASLELQELLLYHVLGQEYGWDPAQIDNLSWKTIQGLLVLLRASAARQHSAVKEQENVKPVES